MKNKEFNLSEKIVGSQGHEYAFLFADVKEFIKRLKEEFPLEECIEKNKTFFRGEVLDKIDKLAGEELIENAK